MIRGGLGVTEDDRRYGGFLEAQCVAIPSLGFAVTSSVAMLAHLPIWLIASPGHPGNPDPQRDLNIRSPRTI